MDGLSAGPLRPAVPGDRELLVNLMSQYYAEVGYPMEPAEAAVAFDRLLGDPHLGRVWLLVTGKAVVGYLVLTLGFSLEYGGTDAFIDDLFVQSAHRGTGLGTAALEAVRASCPGLGIRALHLTVERSNPRAEALYRRLGFKEGDRRLLTLRLASPA